MAKEQKRRRKRRSSAAVLLSGFFTLLIIVIIAGGVGVYWGLDQINKPGPKDADAAFIVPKGSGIGSLAGPLQDQGFISDPMLYKIATIALAKDARVLPGQYTIPAHSSINQIVTLVTTTKPQTFFIDVIPGHTSWDIAQVINDPAQSLTGPAIAVPIEGTLLAVRHDYFPGDTRQSVVDAMEKAMTDKVDEIWANHDPSINDVIKTPHQLVTMASLVERETGVAAERPIVASVFLNRLRKHMRLQTDPSVMYGITLGQTALDRDLTSKDLATKTAYNTYQIDGLPPGPIANPGIDALMAVAHPADTKYLYFVAKDGNPADGHVFSTNYKDHKKNVALYRQAAAESADEAAKDALEAQQASQAGDTGQ